MSFEEAQNPQFTVSWLRRYTETYTVNHFNPHTELGAAVIKGSGSVEFSEPVAKDETYQLTMLCSPSNNYSYSFGVANKTGEKRRIGLVEGCANKGGDTYSLASSYFAGGTSAWIKGESHTTFIIIVYKYKTKLEAERYK
ncbi:hypothetical protein EJ419_02290 [Alloscardovia theropitheci]|uniref:Uncharacterized protein n=1 Tax=Alloscardovia theropitheci TaxID=2496842 RepID=A0A4R0QQU3_9BIFI|nr:hypothetical protein [Alloscardovia theropitheci]TCD54684.1 hypothetical protein EJ419_02290 [Alloscardovia theropitheci]